ncbi:MAG: ABC transporter substrate-binding protein [Desulfosporosinus sp.]|nr:ABC transporter substrate-binding protein [Desulfosporosinus sp.]
MPSSSASATPAASSPSSNVTTVTDFAGTTFSAAKPAKTVMGLHPIFTMLALRLAPDKVVSVDKVFTISYLVKGSPTDVLTNLGLDHIKSLPVTNTSIMQPVDPEQVLNLNPDVVVTLNKDINAAKLKDETKKPLVIVSKNTLQDYSKSMRIMGVVLGNTTEANQMADYWDKIISSISAKTDAIATANRLNVYHCASGSIYATVGKDTIMASVVRIAGGNNLGDQISNPSNHDNESITVSMDQILKWNPDVVVANNSAQYKEIMSSPEWKAVNAVKNGRVYCQLKYGRIDGLTTLPGLIWYNAILTAPGDSSAIDAYYKEAQNFYQLFFKYNIPTDELTIKQ